jgi:acyl-coenzyme A synthetase/AMP-(fatty) acid ligase
MPMKSINITFDIIKTAESHPDNIAIIYRNSQINYKALDLIIWKGSSFLRGIGVKPGDVIAVHTSSDWNTLILMLSITRMGGTVLSLSPSMSELQVKETLREAEVNFIIGDARVSFDTSLRFVEFNFDIIKGISVDKKTLDVVPRAPWIIVSGSGTTGRSKLIPITHQAQRYRNEMSHEWLGLKREDVVASMSHFGFHAPKNRFLETMWAGASYFIDIYKEKNILHACNNYLTVLHATVFHIQKLLLQCQNEIKESLSIRALTVGGSSVPLNIKIKIKQQLTNNLIVRYASNETGPIAFITQPDVFNQDNYVGKLISNIKLNILNVDNKPISQGRSGLIALHSPGNFDGYLKDEMLNSSAFTRYGFILGDLGRLDEEGNLYHLGRFDQMMIFNGINIYPAEIERALLSHAKVDDAASFPMHHSVHQDVPVAAISLKKGETLGEKEILNYCKSVLGSHSPHHVFILNKLPRNERGKLVVATLLNEIKKI